MFLTRSALRGVTGELALGHLPRRSEILRLLQNLPQATAATDDEVLTFIGRRHLRGLGIGYVDAQLLAATTLTTAARLWTRDKQLVVIAAQHGLASADATERSQSRASPLDLH
jgi:predicted nucleic acid-binding protein